MSFADRTYNKIYKANLTSPLSQIHHQAITSNQQLPVEVLQPASCQPLAVLSCYLVSFQLQVLDVDLIPNHELTLHKFQNSLFDLFHYFLMLQGLLRLLLLSPYWTYFTLWIKIAIAVMNLSPGEWLLFLLT